MIEIIKHLNKSPTLRSIW